MTSTPTVHSPSPRTFVRDEAALPPPATSGQRVRIGMTRDDVLAIAGAGAAALSMGLLMSVVLGMIPVGWVDRKSVV